MFNVVCIFMLAAAAALCDLQAECLLQPGVAAGQNLVFSAPTSAGKSLVAKVLLLQHLQQHRQHVVLLVLPLVELCAEMADGLEPLLQQLNKEVMRSYGGLHSGPVRDNTGGVPVASMCLEELLHDIMRGFRGGSSLYSTSVVAAASAAN